MEYKKSSYQVCQALNDQVVLCSSSVSGLHILLSTPVYSLYEEGRLDVLHAQYPKVFKRLQEGRFVVERDVDEYSDAAGALRRIKEDTTMYQLIVNPTLDCNLSCWYCYENRVPHSSMEDGLTEAVVKNIRRHFVEHPYKLLKLSFFGGEPFLKPRVIKSIVSGADEACRANSTELLLDFTTNGTLLTESMLDFLKGYQCMFQITLDGNRQQHNKIKFTSNKQFDAFSTTVGNIRRIQDAVKDSFVAVRINFDEVTLDSFDAILEELKPLDRLRTKIILKKVWQVDEEKVCMDKVYDVMEKLFRNDFIVDYNSQVGPCFADRTNEAVINYDGNVFKCTTICSFDKESSFGSLDRSSGEIVWDSDKTSRLNSQETPEYCKTCAYFPACGGPCNMKMLTGEQSCDLVDMKVLKKHLKTQFEISYITKRIHLKYAK